MTEEKNFATFDETQAHRVNWSCRAKKSGLPENRSLTVGGIVGKREVGEPVPDF
jgi:hypothetical protein